MADRITIEGAWINKVKELSFGTILEVASNQRAKDQVTGEWTTVGKTYYEVTAADGVSFVGFKEGDQVSLSGSFKAVKWERDGKSGLNLKVRASEIKVAERSAPKTDNFAAPAGWEEVPTF